MPTPAKGNADYLLLGDWNALCFFCSRKFKAGQLLKHWQGFYVCSDCFEPRHPQDFVRGVKDEQTVPWSQPEPADSFVALCTPNTSTCYPDWAEPDCVMPEYISPLFNDSLEMDP